MILIIPIGKNTSLAKMPWITLGLILVNVAVFLLVWPDEKKHLISRSPDSPLFESAADLVDLASSRESPVPANEKSILKIERFKYSFPTVRADEVFSSINEHRFDLGLAFRENWEEIYFEYGNAKSEFDRDGTPWTSLYEKYGVSQRRPWFPTLLTHQFLHVGFLHLFFNMLFLWIVGCNVEERWGPLIFLALYLSGGAVAAWVQSTVFSAGNRYPLVGASGAIAAIMGAFLARHSDIRIKFFYFAWVKWGQFSVPAWVALPLWALGQFFSGQSSLESMTVGVAYWAHLGGFGYGLLSGLAIRASGVAGRWEKSAEQTPVELNRRTDHARLVLMEGKALNALYLFKEILEQDPGHVEATAGMLAAQEQLQLIADGCHTAVQVIRSACASGRQDRASESYRRWKGPLQSADLSETETMALAQSLESLRLWEDAATFYRSIIEKRKDSPFRGKALFAAGQILKKRLRKPEEAAVYFQQLLQQPHVVDWGHLAQAELGTGNSGDSV